MLFSPTLLGGESTKYTKIYLTKTSKNNCVIYYNVENNTDKHHYMIKAASNKGTNTDK